MTSGLLPTPSPALHAQHDAAVKHARQLTGEQPVHGQPLEVVDLSFHMITHICVLQIKAHASATIMPPRVIERAPPSQQPLAPSLYRMSKMTPLTTPGVTRTRAARNLNGVPAVKKYKCDVCAKAFSRSNTLITHKVGWPS
jgi:hypothetical protein